MKSEQTKCQNRIQKLLTSICRSRDQKCIFEGKTDMSCAGYTAADHIINRWKKSTYALSRNVILACTAHHIFWKKRNPTIYSEIVREYIGEGVYRDIHETAKSLSHYSIKDWLALEDGLKKEL